MKTDKTPPQSDDAEKALLGALIIQGDNLIDVQTTISCDSFSREAHAKIFKAIEEVGEHGKVDLLTLSEKLKSNGDLKDIGGDSYLAELTTSVPSGANFSHYAEIIHDKHTRREMITSGYKILELAYDEASHIENSIDEAEKSLSSIGQAVRGGDFYSMEEGAIDALKRIKSIRSGDSKLRGVSTGFNKLDIKLSGLQPSDLIILAARPSVGKTSLALDIARKMAVNDGHHVAIFSLEMSKDQLIDRMIAAEARVDAWKLRTGNLKDDDYQGVQDAISRLKSAPIHIDDNSSNNVLRIKSAARKLKQRQGLDVIIVDYLQLLAPLSKGGNVSLVQEVTEISRSLKQLAKELDVPVIALSQLSRNVEHRGENAEPRLADLRDSGSIEQDADVVMFIHRNKGEDDNNRRSPETKLIIEKHRNGATGVIDLIFDADKSSFLEVEKSFDKALADDFAALD
jgi:replicative DNA helicase